GFKLNFEDSGPTGTPAINDGLLFTSQGYYSSNIYCFDANNGAFKWATSLSESGPSPFVISDDVLLTFTESCTLYALSAKTGKLLWSKWISEWIFSTRSEER